MNTYQKYRAPGQSVPAQCWAWQMRGPGLERIGVNAAPELVPVRAPAADQLLVRIDAVGLCFSDVKIIQQGGKHPKLYGRDLEQQPTRLGHEVALTVIEVGADLRGKYVPGQRLAMQPDIYHAGRSMAYGYTVPGGLVQYHLIGPEVLVTDDGPCLLPLSPGRGYAESALLEPWGCVMAAYTQRRRLHPLVGGKLWVIGDGADMTSYTWPQGLAPALIVLSHAPASVRGLAEGTAARTGARIVIRDDASDAAGLTNSLAPGGFDDIIMLRPRSATMVSAVARCVARRGTLNLVGDQALDGLVDADVGRLHYDYIAFLGTRGSDIGAAYGEARNRCELRANGVTAIIGAGGPMGQMHLQRALELPNGPRLVIATELNDVRLKALQARFAPLAAHNQRELQVINTSAGPEVLRDAVAAASAGAGADDVVVCVPSGPLMAQAGALLRDDGMLILFAGVPNGSMAPLNVSNVFLGNAQFTGTSGLTLRDQALVMKSADEKTLSPGRSVAAIGGMRAAHEGIHALMTGRYAGKIVIFPQLHDLPLLALEDLKQHLPDVAAQLAPDGAWTPAAEEVLINASWQS